MPQLPTIHGHEVLRDLDEKLLALLKNLEFGGWFLIWKNNAWHLTRQTETPPTAAVGMPDRIAWRIFMKSIDSAEARGQVSFSGNQRLGEHLLTLLAVMA